MTYHRLAYDDLASTTEMTSDCLAAESNLHRAQQAQDTLSPLLTGGASPARRELEVSDSLAEMAAGLHLHFD